MNKITEKKKVNQYIFLFMILYLISYVTRINYGAVISEIVRAESMLKSEVSLAVTGSFVTYGLGQLVSGFMGDKIQPKLLILAGLIVTVTMNLLIPMCSSPYAMLVIWCINGFAQAFMWPPLVKLMTYFFTEETYKKACMIVSWGSSFGTIIVYLAAPLCIALFNWRTVFFISAALGLVMAVIWSRMPVIIEMENSVDGEKNESGRIPWSMLIVLIMLAIVLQGSLRDGVTTWMPSYILETYNLSSSISILTAVILPIFSIVSFNITSIIYRRKLKNELICGGAMFAAGFAAALLLSIFAGSNAVLSILLSAVLTGCMHGVNLILICMIPPYFKKYGCVSFASGLFNSCTYVGSAVSAYGIAVFSENFGWQSTIVLWSVIALAGTLICFTMSGKWKKFISKV